MICPNCKTEMIFQDESFNHAFGTEIIKYYYCESCHYDEMI
jgi:C4-type Zn-finger protein